MKCYSWCLEEIQCIGTDRFTAYEGPGRSQQSGWAALQPPSTVAQVPELLQQVRWTSSLRTLRTRCPCAIPSRTVLSLLRHRCSWCL